MINRRNLIRSSAIAGALSSAPGIFTEALAATGALTMPDESHPHIRTWMAYGAQEAIWGSHLLPEVQRNLATIANTVSKFEPVTMLVRKHELESAKTLVGPGVTLLVAALDDLWIRDSGPIFTRDKAGVAHAIDFNFNGWGEKQRFTQDARVASLIAKDTGAKIQNTSLVLEGGCIEVDGRGTAIIAESCVLNDNRNPGVTKHDFESLIKPLLGLEKIIWIPGIAGRDITDGHTDFYARFASPGVVLAGYDPDPGSYDHLVTKSHLDILRTATDAAGRTLEVGVLEAPSRIRHDYANDDFAAGYIGFYVCNGGVIVQNFGDEQADAAAHQTITRAFPGRKLKSIAIDGIAAGGGSIHCATQQQPA